MTKILFATRTNMEELNTTYRQRLHEITIQLEIIHKTLAADYTPEKATWPKAGDLGHLRQELQELVDFLRR